MLSLLHDFLFQANQQPGSDTIWSALSILPPVDGRERNSNKVREILLRKLHALPQRLNAIRIHSTLLHRSLPVMAVVKVYK